MTLPWQTYTPLYVPRRDLVASVTDSLLLTVIVTQTDDPEAPLIDLTTGPTFPDFKLRIWRTQFGARSWDYGGVAFGSGDVLYAGDGIVSPPSAVTFSLPMNAMVNWPQRCGWCVQMGHDEDLQDTLASGYLHLRGAGNTMMGADVSVPLSTTAMTQWLQSLPTAPSSTPGWWNNGGIPTYS